MSTHSNEARKGGPSAPDRKKIEGHNATYRSAVQKDAKKSSSTKPEGKGSDTKKVTGKGSAPAMAKETENVGGYGDGHYKPNKG